MKRAQLWHRMLTRPGPRRPVQLFFGITAGAFALGLMASLVVPASWATDQVPIRIDLPFRAGAFGALIAFASTGMMLMGARGRKIFILTAVLLLPVMIGAEVALLAPIFSEPTMDFATLTRRLPTIQWITYGSLAILTAIPACGWFRWLQEIGRKENAAWERRMKQTSSAEANSPESKS